MSTEGESRPTTASIDRRVERLEIAQADTNRKVDQLGVEMRFMKEFMETKFSVVELSLGNHSTKFDNFVMKIEGMIAESLKAQGDIEATPIGRQVSSRLASLEGRIDNLDTFLDQFRGFGSGFRFYILPVAAIALSVWSIATR